MTCPICKKLLWESKKTPCCDTAFCDECITQHLVDHSFECPVCESKIASLNKLKIDEALRRRVKSYVDGEIQRSKQEEEEEKEKQAAKANASGVQGDGKGKEGSSTESKVKQEPGTAADKAVEDTKVSCIRRNVNRCRLTSVIRAKKALLLLAKMERSPVTSLSRTMVETATPTMSEASLLQGNRKSRPRQSLD